MITSDDEIGVAELAGREAYDAGLPMTANPLPKNGNRWWGWNLGWKRSQFFHDLETEIDRTRREEYAKLKAAERPTGMFRGWGQ